MEELLTITRTFGKEPNCETLEIHAPDPDKSVNDLERQVCLQVIAVLKRDGRNFPLLHRICENLGVWSPAEENGKRTSLDELVARILAGLNAITEGNIQRKRNNYRQKISATVCKYRK